jgi:membrane protein required for beta-lactamase induction
MNLIALFIGLVLERTLTDLLELREPRLLDGYFDWLLRAMDRNPGVPAYIIAGIGIVLPVLPVLWIAHAFGANLLGLPYVAFASLVLVVSLGPRDLGREVRDYIAASEAGDPLSAERLAKEILESDAPTAPGGRVRAVEEAILVQANNRIFGVIFWFMLLGPAGALLFRVADLFRRRAVFEAGRSSLAGAGEPQSLVALTAIFGTLAWLPARLLAVGYAIAGSFEDAVADWRAYYDDCSESFFRINEDVICAAGMGALRSASGSGSLAEPAAAAAASLKLVNRTLVVWLTGISILTLLGFAG